MAKCALLPSGMKPGMKKVIFLVMLMTVGMLVFKYVGTNNIMSSVFMPFENIDANLRYPAILNITTGKNLSVAVKHGRSGHHMGSPANESTNNTRSSVMSPYTMKTDVAFLKVHKAGSTTVMNIFLRFATRHKLNIVLPKSSSGFGFNYLGYGTTVSRDKIVPLPANETYNILCNHVVYNREAFRSIMPSDTMYVAIIREPTSQFVSAASYYGFFKNVESFARSRNITNVSPITQYLRDPSSFKVGTYFVRNRMSFDFGMPVNQFTNDTFIDKYVQQLDDDYGLVMVMENFYESLVLMRRELTWDTRDILYVPLNAQRSEAKLKLSNEDKERLQQWNRADYKLYNHFKAAFDAKLKAHGQDLLDEVESFKRIQARVKTFCGGGRDDFVVVPETQWGASFLVERADCRLMMEPELVTMKRLIEGAWHRYNQSVIHPGNRK